MGPRERRKKARKLHVLQDGLCAFCGVVVDYPAEGRERHPGDVMAPTLDHVVHKSQGGSDRLTNLLLAHRICNGERSDGDLPERARRVWQSNVAQLEAMQLAAAA